MATYTAGVLSREKYNHPRVTSKITFFLAVFVLVIVIALVFQPAMSSNNFDVLLYSKQPVLFEARHSLRPCTTHKLSKVKPIKQGQVSM